MSRPFAVTTPIYYVNGLPHIGHTYSTIVADTVARYHRLAGDTVFFQTGMDEHGEKAEAAAAASGEPVESYAARVAGAWRETWDELGISYDRFIRTTDSDHEAAVTRILQAVWDAGQIEFREYEGLYCVGCERFLTERDMEDGLCRDHETAPDPRHEANYFFKMSDHFAWLTEHLEANPDFIEPKRYRNEVLAMIREDSGLEDLCISRPKERLSWGVELPFDTDYVCYVWFDALINYLTGCGYPDQPGWEERWQACIHLIGKDIVKPHGVFWPTMLHAAGIPLPRGLRVHGYWQIDDRKVSKSLGNMIDPLAMQERYGFENFRYYLLREMSFGLDGSFSEAAMVETVNAHLANALGNLVSRTLNMTARYTDGRVPAPGAVGEAEATVRTAAEEAARGVAEHTPRFEIHRALEALFRLVDAANVYVDQREPWKAAKDPGRAEEVRTTLYTCCQALRFDRAAPGPLPPRSGRKTGGAARLDGRGRSPPPGRRGRLGPAGTRNAHHQGRRPLPPPRTGGRWLGTDASCGSIRIATSRRTNSPTTAPPSSTRRPRTVWSG